ncbi:hypothetical protein ES703_110260 [subsurface metagenome]
MQGGIDMNGQHLHGLKGPVHATDGVRKKYADDHDLFIVHADTPASYAGQALKVARVNAAQNALEFATMVGGYTEGARVYHSAHQNIPNLTLTTVAFNLESYDTDSIHDNAVNNSRLTCKTAGKYLITAPYLFAGNAAGYRQAYLRVNGVTTIVYSRLDSPGGGEFFLLALTTWDLAVNDYVELLVYQTSGVALNLICVHPLHTHFIMQRIG